MIKYLTVCIACLFILAACGGGGGGGPIGSMDQPPLTSPMTPTVTMHGSVAVGYGTIMDGVDGTTLAGFLTHHRRTDSPYGEGMRWASTPPVVRVVSGATTEYIQQTQRAVELINSALPPDWQMIFDPTPRNAQERTFGHANGEYFDGEITVLFANSENYGRHGGWSQTRPGRDPDHYDQENVVVASRISVAIDHGGTPEHRQALIIHEIGHTLGIGGDFWAEIYKLYPNSIMTYEPGAGERWWNGSSFIYALDRDSFRALYSVLQPGMTPDEIYTALDAWEDSTVHIRGDLDIPGGTVSFGASGRNGFMGAWFGGGASPSTDLADNLALSESVEWNGRLLGIDNESHSVAGAAKLSVDLATLDGNMDFAELESWVAAPGATGTGTTWGDGDLAYGITIRGNAFGRTGGDKGTLTGRFVGLAHEGMAGTLERDDLAAGFSGVRSPTTP